VGEYVHKDDRNGVPDPVNVKVDTQTFAVQSGTVTGRIYLKCSDDLCFPERDWNDFPVIILTWWLDAMFAFVTALAPAVQLHFMDGPFSVKICKCADRLECDLVKDDNVTGQCSAAIDELSRSLVGAAESVGHFCEVSGIDTLEVKHLHAALLKFETSLG
jgi:hypothetical protein